MSIAVTSRVFVIMLWNSFEARPARVCVQALPFFLEMLTAWHPVVVSGITDPDPIRSLGGGGIRV